MITRKQIIAELQKELGMRRNVWARIPGEANKEVFVKAEHQARYDTMRHMVTAFEEMTDLECAAFFRRAAAREEQKLQYNQNTLFT